MKYLNVSNVKALGARGQQQTGASPLLAGSKTHNPTPHCAGAGADGWHVDGAFKDSG